MASLDKSLENLAEEVAGYGYQLEEAAGRLRDYLDNLGEDPERLDEITARIDLLQQMKRKYGPSLEDVLEYGSEAVAELEDLEKMDQRLDSLRSEVTELAGGLGEMGKKLSTKRREVAEKLTGAVDAELLLLCLENARFDISFGDDGERTVETISRKGWDRPEFMFSANPGEPLKALAKVASGGELSRLMLALKSILARHDHVGTVVFDEIDAGISGKTAEAVARKIKDLSRHHQVICITHLPQIASCARQHFTVIKEVSEERTHTKIDRLSEEMRVEELARMLDGESVTGSTRDYVKELLERNQS
jgi:DNA repair protein RecN (Recombination protein N)